VRERTAGKRAKGAKGAIAEKPARSSSLELIVHFGNGGRLTAEDLVLIEAIRKERSILAASRATGISYRKCWLMVDALNRTFETPVLATHPGRTGSGTDLTPFGERVVALYKSMERRARSATAQAAAELTASLDPAYRERASAEVSERPPSQSPAFRSRRS
jgi:molybdate transport system regulatory protein